MTSKEWDAAAYDRLSSPQLTWGTQVLDRLDLHGGERLLDAGCGSGRVTIEIARRIPRGEIFGVDLSENMMRTTAAAFAADVSDAAAPGAFVCADLLSLPFHDCFDVVFSSAVFHWVGDHPRLFGSIGAALRRGGRLEAQCGAVGNLGRIHARANALAARPPFQPHFTSWTDPWQFATPEATEDNLRQSGFTHVRCWIEEAPVRFEDGSTYRDFLETVVMRPYLARLPNEPLRHAFLDTLVDAGEHDDPPRTLDYWRLNISASR